jgi:hypothetical protein
VAKLSSDVMFSHKAHAEKDMACGDCHKGIETSEHVDPSLAVRKWACMDCHARKEASNDCALCHRVIRQEVAVTLKTCGTKSWHTPQAMQPLLIQMRVMGLSMAFQRTANHRRNDAALPARVWPFSVGGG